jgi:hypothetical protein
MGVRWTTARCRATRCREGGDRDSSHLGDRYRVADHGAEVELAAFREAEQAHGQYEKEELGGVRDEEWAPWSEFIVNALSERADTT